MQWMCTNIYVKCLPVTTIIILTCPKPASRVHAEHPPVSERSAPSGFRFCAEGWQVCLELGHLNPQWLTPQGNYPQHFSCPWNALIDQNTSPQCEQSEEKLKWNTFCQKEMYLPLPVAHRFPLGFTLILETLFLSSVKSRVIDDVMAMYEIRIKEDRNPVLQILARVPLIPNMYSKQTDARQNRFRFKISVLRCYFRDWHLYWERQGFIF